MNFPLNLLKLDQSYISAIENDAENTVLAQYAVFKKISAMLVKLFQKYINTYGSIDNIPEDLLKKHDQLLSELMNNYRNLRNDLYIHLNRTAKLLENIFQSEGNVSFFYSIACKKQKKLKQKIEYYNAIERFYNYSGRK